MRWSVVPHAFRRLLPERIKSHDSHDIVLLCRACHAVIERPYTRHRAALLSAASIADDTRRVHVDAALAKVRSAGRALVSRKASALPTERRRELEAMISAHFGPESEEPAEVLARRAAALDPSGPRDGYVAPEERLVAALSARPDADEALAALSAGWRELFVATLRPSALPAGWSVSHRAAARAESSAE